MMLRPARGRPLLVARRNAPGRQSPGGNDAESAKKGPYPALDPRPLAHQLSAELDHPPPGPHIG